MKPDPRKLKSWIRNGVIIAVLIMGVLMYLNYGWLSVPAGMDTMPDECPAGALCLIQKWPKACPVGSVVFVDVAGGGTVVTRVKSVVGDDLVVEHDNKRSRLGFQNGTGAVSIGAVRGLVICTFPEEKS